MFCLFCDHVNSDTHLNIPRTNLYILIAIWDWDDLHLVQHNNVMPEHMCLILCSTTQVYNFVKVIACRYGGRFAEPTKIS